MTRAERNIDWEAIEREYRAGQLSIREIGRQYGCTDAGVRVRAKKEGWVRDLSAKVRSRVRSDLVRDAVRSDDAREVVDAAAARGVEVVRSHRAHISALWAIIADARTQLGRHLSGEEGRCAVFESSGDGVASLLRTLSSATSQVIPLERQAFSLDEPATGTDARSKEERDAIAAAAARADT